MPKQEKDIFEEFRKLFPAFSASTEETYPKIEQFFQQKFKEIAEEIDKIEVDNAGEDLIKLKALNIINKTDKCMNKFVNC